MSQEYEGFERLDRLVRSLVEKFEALRAAQGALQEELEEREARIGSLEEQVLQLNQARRDAAKRIDDLISQIDHLDALGATEPGAEAPGSK